VHAAGTVFLDVHSFHCEDEGVRAFDYRYAACQERFVAIEVAEDGEATLSFYLVTAVRALQRTMHSSDETVVPFRRSAAVVTPARSPSS
jgi:hypothetical protein